MAQEEFTNQFTELLRDDLFKHHINESFCKLIPLLIPKLKGTEQKRLRPPVYDIFRMTAQIFGTEDLCLIPIKNSTIMNLYNCLKNTINTCQYPGEIAAEQFDEVASLINYGFLKSHKKAGLELIYNIIISSMRLKY